MFESRMNDIERAENAPDDENLREQLLEGALGVSVQHTIKIELSTGGPGDGFMLDYDSGWDLVGGSHYYVDWGFRRETPLTVEEAQRVADMYGIEPGNFGNN